MIPIWRSPPLRVAVAFALSVSLSAYAVSAIVYMRIYSADISLVQSLLKEEIDSTRHEALPLLREQLARRLTQDLRHIDFVGLYDGEGSLTYGNIDLGLEVARDGRFHLLHSPSPDGKEPGGQNAVFIAVAIDGGGSLVLGRTLTYVDRLGGAVRQGFLLAMAPVVLIALSCGLFASLQAWRRISAIKEAIDRVVRGDIQVRLPVDRRRDDVSDLVGSVNAMLDEIAHLLQQLSAVGHNIAHDLRAPLAVMRLKLERSLTLRSEEAVRELVSDTLEDLERANMAVAALLRVAEIDGRLRRGRFALVDLAKVCCDVFELYEPLAEEKGVSFTSRLCPMLVEGDDDLLHEAVSNLVDNAVKYTPSGGAVSLSCGQKPSLIRVSDNGPGIAADERDQVMDRFYRAKLTIDAPGSGLGLSVTKTIIDQHGFKLRISDARPGAVFEILI